MDFVRISKILEKWSAIYELDARSLSIFRIALAACLLWECAQYGKDLDSLYSDSGIVSVAEALAHRGGGGWPLSAFLLGESARWQGGVLAVLSASSLALMIGWQPRIAAGIAWLCLTAFQLRNPYVQFGADAFLRLMTMFAFLLPLRGNGWLGVRLLQPASDRSAAAMALRLQVATVFLVAGWVKLVSPEWQRGVGVQHAFDYAFLAQPLAVWLREYPAVGFALTHATTFLEVVGALMLLAPCAVPRLRSLGILSMMVMCVGFSAGLRVGLFPVVGIVALSALLPGAFWDLIGVRHSIESAPRVSPIRRFFRGGVACAIAAYIVVWNVGLLRDAQFQAPRWMQGYADLLQLQQRWGMFTRLPSTGWLVIPGELRDGRRLNLLRAGGPLPELQANEGRVVDESRPTLVADSFRNVRWSILFLGMVEHVDFLERAGQLYGRYLCREWNQRYSADDQLIGFEIIYFHRPPADTPSVAQAYERSILWAHNCFG